MDAEWQKREDEYVRGGNNPYIKKYCELVKAVATELPCGYHQIMFKTSTGFDFQTVDAAGNKNYLGAKVPGALRIFKEESQGTNIAVKAAGKIRAGQEYIENMGQWRVVRFGCTTTPKIYSDLVELKYISHRLAG